MKIAVVYNRASQRVINPLGPQNLEKYGRKNVKRIVDALKAGKHQVAAFEGDKDLIDHLEEFMPRVVQGERPGMVFNVAYGIQGQARYTHVPGILEMIGIPYVGSGPLAHSLSLDKVVAKSIFQQTGLPTPGFAVLQHPEDPLPDLPFPLIVKPRNEAVSFGLKVVHDADELREAAQVIFDRFQQSVLVEEFIDGREINVGLLGNDATEALPPVELVFGEGGPNVYTYEDKSKGTGRVTLSCPADLTPEQTEEVKDLAIRAFKSLGCYDCARVDFRMRPDGNFSILEINSLPSLGQRGSYVHAAEVAGMDFTALTNRLVEVASQRYFGTPAPPAMGGENDPAQAVFSYVTQNRDKIERRIKSWVGVQSRSTDPVGISGATSRLGREFRDLGLTFVEELSNNHAYTWRTKAGLDDGTLFVLHLDVPVAEGMVHEGFRREPEWLLGEGIGSSRAPLVTLSLALRSLKHVRALNTKRIGVLVYTDEGRDARYSAEMIRRASARAREVLVLRPGNATERVFSARRGQRTFRFAAEGKPRRPGSATKKPELFRWASQKLDAMSALSSREQRVALSVVDMKVHAFPLHLPHRVTAEVLLTYPTAERADALESEVRTLFGKEGHRWQFEQITDRPPMVDRKENRELRKRLEGIAGWWTVPLKTESSLWPSVAGLVEPPTAVVCGLGPPASDLHTPREAVQRIALMQRTLLLAEYLLERPDA